MVIQVVPRSDEQILGSRVRSDLSSTQPGLARRHELRGRYDQGSNVKNQKDWMRVMNVGAFARITSRTPVITGENNWPRCLVGCSPSLPGSGEGLHCPFLPDFPDFRTSQFLVNDASFLLLYACQLICDATIKRFRIESHVKRVCMSLGPDRRVKCQSYIRKTAIEKGENLPARLVRFPASPPVHPFTLRSVPRCVPHRADCTDTMPSFSPSCAAMTE